MAFLEFIKIKLQKANGNNVNFHNSFFFDEILQRKIMQKVLNCLTK